MDTLIILCAKYLIWVVVLGGLLYWAGADDKKRLAVFAALSLAVTYVVAWAAGHVWYDPRPFVTSGIAPLVPHAANNGFPSDHMLLGAAIAAIVFTRNRAWGLVLGALALVVGVARVWAGIHHYVDLVGSIVIAVCVVAAVDYGLRRWHAARV